MMVTEHKPAGFLGIRLGERQRVQGRGCEMKWRHLVVCCGESIDDDEDDERVD